MESIWKRTCNREKRPALEGHIRADVAVIGGGMAGVLTAWHLEQAGVNAVILEADQIGSGQASEEVLQEYIDKLNSVNVQTILDEYQRQLDEWLAAQ